MKVLIAVDTIPYTSETFVLNHIKGLLDAGIEVKICAFNRPVNQQIHSIFYDYHLSDLITYKPKLSSNPVVRFAKGLYIFSKCVLVNPVATFRALNFFKYGIDALKLIYLYEMSVFVTKENFDLIHCHFGTMSKKVAFYQHWGLLKSPLITTFHGYDVDSPEIREDSSYYADLKKRGCLYFVNSAYTLQRVVQLGFDQNKIVTVPVSLDTNYFKKNEKHNTEKCSALTELITVARLVEFKGVAYTLRALRLVKENNHVNFRYRIIGDGPLRSELENLTTELDLSENVFFMGSRNQSVIKELLDGSDIFLLTGIRSSDGRQENQGLVIQEAQAMQLPVIVSDLGGVGEGIIDGETGFLVEEKNIKQIADKIVNLSSDKDLRIQMGKQGRIFVENKYSIESITKILISNYKKIISLKN